jgi:hypothetical protein
LFAVTLWFAYPGSAYYVLFGLSMPTLYANATLVVLNARFEILGGRGTFHSAADTLSAAPVEFRNLGTNGGTPTQAGRSPIVVIEREAFSEVAENDQMRLKTMDVRLPLAMVRQE